jgi:uncharacterized protein (TIGR02466 family)
MCMHNLSIPVQPMTMWPTYMFVTKYRDWPFDKKEILSAVDAEVSKQTTDIESKVAENVKTPGLKEGDFDFLKKQDTYPVLAKLESFFKEAVKDVVTNGIPKADPKFILNIDVETTITDCWYHKTNNGGAHGVHAHPGSSWSGIFYVNTTDCDVATHNGINRFHNVASVTSVGDVGSMWWSGFSSVEIAPLEGHLVLFPGWMYHEATAFTGSKDRVVISFNSVTNKIGG